LAELVAKVRREERYHRMHLVTWIDRLANGGADARSRISRALETAGRDADSVFTPINGEAALLRAGILTRSVSLAATAWRTDVLAVLGPFGLAGPVESTLSPDGRSGHSDAFRWLWGEFTSVRRTEVGATW
jgi:ring-1,2-phenylacetyl-CoA epoxidase subunit PaaC